VSGDWTQWLLLALGLAFMVACVVMAGRANRDDLEAAQHELYLDELWGPDEEWIEP
jgi:hypothetical protein